MKVIRMATAPLAIRYLLRGQLSFLKRNGVDIKVVCSSGPLIQEIESYENCKCVTVEMTRAITPFKDFYSLLKLCKLFLEEKPDIVHTNTPKAGLLGMLAAKLIRVPVRLHSVTGIRFMTTKGFKYHVLRLMEKLTYMLSTHVNPEGESLSNYIVQESLCRKDKIIIIGAGSINGVDTTRYNLESLNDVKMDEVKYILDYNQDYKYILFVGRVVKDKGVEELIRVFIKLASLDKSLRLILLGPLEQDLDPISKEIIQAIENSEEIQHIEWTNDVEYYMALATILIHPSHREGFPNVLLQAACLKCPILCSDIVGNIDIVKDGVDGILFKVKDEVQLKEKTLYALENGQLMKEFAEKLRTKVVSLYEIKHVQNELLDTYYNLLRN